MKRYREQKTYCRLYEKLAMVVAFVLFFGIGVFQVLPVHAAIPQTLGYQGHLKNSSGTALTGTYSFVFRLYASSTGGVAMWTETQPSIAVDAGYFSVRIGSITPFPGTFDFSQPLFISTEVNGDGQMTPRVAVNSVPYAFTAGGIDTFNTAPVSATGGRMYYDTTAGSLNYYDGTVGLWRDISSALGNDSVTDAMVVNGLTIDATGSIDAGAINTGTLGNASVTLDLTSFGAISGMLNDANVSNVLTLSGSTIDNSPIGDSIPSTGIFTNATTTNFFATNGTFTNLTVPNPLNVTGLTWVDANGTNTTSTNLFATEFQTTNGTTTGAFYVGNDLTVAGSSFIQNLTWLNGTGTNIELTGTTDILNLTFTNATGANLMTTNVLNSTFLHADESTIGVATATILNVDAVLHVGLGNFPVIADAVAQFGANTNTHLLVNTQNRSSGWDASSDYRATADNGDGDNYFVDLGINSSGYNDPDFTLSGPNDSYLIAQSHDLLIGVASSTGDVILFTGGQSTSSEALRITSDHFVGIGTTNPSSTLDVVGNGRFTGTLMSSGSLVCLENGTNCPSSVSADFQTVTNGGNTTTNSIVFNGGTSTGDFIFSGNLAVSGAASLQGVTFTNTTSTSSTSTNLFVTNGAFTNLTITNPLTASGLTWTNATGTNSTSTNLFATNATFTNSTSSNLFATNGVFTGFTTGNATLSGGTINGTTIGATTPSTGVFTNSTSTNLFATNGTIANLSITNPLTVGGITWTNATGTNTTSTNLAVTGSLFLPADSVTDAMVVPGLTIDATGSINAGAINSGTLGNASVILDLTSFGSISGMLNDANVSNILTLSGSTIDNSPIGDSIPSTGIFTNVTTTNFFATNGTFTNLTVPNPLNVTGLTWVDANGTNTTSTNLFATNFGATNGTTTGAMYVGGSLTVAGASFLQGLTWLNATGTNIDLIGTTNIQNLVFTNATGTNLTTTGIVDSTFLHADESTIGAATATIMNVESVLHVGLGNFPVIADAVAQFGANTNTHLLVNTQNRSNGWDASSDYRATADNGDSNNYFVDLGINSSGYADPDFTLSGPNDSYLFAQSHDLLIGVASSSGDVVLFTGGQSTSSEVMRITSDHFVGIGTTNPSSTLDVIGDGRFTGNLTANGLTWINATGTSVTTTNLYVTNFSAANLTPTNLSYVNGTSTAWFNFNSASGTNLFAASVQVNGSNVCLQNGTNCPSGTSTDFQTVTNSGNTTTNAIVFNGGTSTSDFVISGNLTVNALSTLQGTTFTNTTSTNSSSTNLYATNGTIDNLTITNPLTVNGLNWTNATGTNTTSTNLFATNASFTNFSAVNLNPTNLTFTNGTSTSWFGFNTASGTSLFATSIQVNGSNVCLEDGTNCPSGTSTDFQTVTNSGNTTTNAIVFNGGTSTSDFVINGNLTVDNLSILQGTTFTDTTSTNSTSTNLFATNGAFTNLAVTNPFTVSGITWTNATGTNTTSTNLFVTNGAFTNATSTNFFATNFSTTNFSPTNITWTNATGTNTTSTNLFATNGAFENLTFTGGTSTAWFGFATASGTTLNALTAGFNTLTTGNAIISGGTINGTTIGATTPSTGVFTNSTSTNLFATNGTIANLSITNPLSVGGIIWTNATGTNTTSTNLAVTGSLTLPANSVTDAMVVPGLTIDATGSINAGAINSGTLGSASVTLALGSFGAITGTLGDANISNALTLAGSTIDNSPIGATTPSTGVFTNVTTTNLFATTGAFTNVISGNVTFTGGTINGTTIGATTPSTGTFTDTTSTNLFATNGTIANLTITNPLTVGGITWINATGTNTTSTNLFATNETVTNLTFTNGTSTAYFSFATASGTTLNAQTATLANVNSGNVTSTNLFATNGTIANLTITNPLTVSGITWTSATGTNTTSTNLFVTNLRSTNDTVTNLTFTGGTSTAWFGFAAASGTTLNALTAGFNTLTTGNATISGGTINGVSIGATTPSTGVFTNTTSTNSTSTKLFATTGAFTNLTVTNPLSVGGITWTNATGTNTTSTNLAVTGSLTLPANSVTDAMVVPGLTIDATGSINAGAINSGTLGNASVTLALGSFGSITGTLSDANVSNVLTLSGSTIDNSPIGATTPSTGVFTNATATNLFATNFTATNFNPTGLTWTNATGTNTTTTNLGVTGSLLVGGKKVCLADGTNCTGSSGVPNIKTASSTTLVTLTTTLQPTVNVTTTPTGITNQMWVTATAVIKADSNTTRNINSRIIRGDTCTGGTLVGVNTTSTNTTLAQAYGVSISFVDSPNTVSAVNYILCVNTSGGFPTVQGTSITAEEVRFGADLAEIYYSTDGAIAPGEVVSLDSSAAGQVLRSNGAYDTHTLGVVSTRPGLVIGDKAGEGSPVMVALAGRIPVKVSAVNGAIASGDYLTASNIPGVAMKATKAGNTIGQALSSFDGEDVGTVIMFAKNGSYQGKLADTAGTAVDLLSGFAQQSTTSTKDNASLIVTDKIVAGLEIVTPKITTQYLDVFGMVNASSISAGLIVSPQLDLMTADIAQTSSTLQTVLEGLQFASSTLAVHEDRLTSAEAMIGSLRDALATVTSTTAVENSTPTLNLADLKIDGGLEIQGEAIFNGGLLVDKINSIGSLLTFAGDTYFFGRPYVNADTAGFAVVRKGDRSVEVVFDREYAAQPVINATVSFDQIDEATSTYENRLDQYFYENNAFVITRKSVHGFTLLLEKNASEDMAFNWIALAVKDVRTAISSPVVESPTPEPIIEPVTTPVPEPSPVPTPEPVVAPTPEPTPEPVIEPVLEPAPTPEPVVAPIPEPTPEPVVEPAPVSEPVVAPIPEPTPEPVVESAPTPAPEPAPAPAPAPEPAPPATP